MHPLSLAITGLVSSLAHLTIYTSRQAESIQGLVFTAPIRSHHVALAVELAFKAHQEVLKLECGSILGFCQADAAIIGPVINGVDQIAISQTITWGHRTLKVGAFHSSYHNYRRDSSRIFLWLFYFALFFLSTSQALPTFCVRQPYV